MLQTRYSSRGARMIARVTSTMQFASRQSPACLCLGSPKKPSSFCQSTSRPNGRMPSAASENRCHPGCRLSAPGTVCYQYPRSTALVHLFRNRLNLRSSLRTSRAFSYLVQRSKTVRDKLNKSPPRSLSGIQVAGLTCSLPMGICLIW